MRPGRPRESLELSPWLFMWYSECVKSELEVSTTTKSDGDGNPGLMMCLVRVNQDRSNAVNDWRISKRFKTLDTFSTQSDSNTSLRTSKKNSLSSCNRDSLTWSCPSHAWRKHPRDPDCRLNLITSSRHLFGNTFQLLQWVLHPLAA